MASSGTKRRREDAAHHPLVAPEAMPFLVPWFSQYGGSSHREIEARIKDVSRGEFEYICARLSSPAFIGTLSTTLDTNYRNRTRCTQTVGPGLPSSRPSFMRKEQLERADVLDRAVRFSVSSETAAVPPGEFDSVEVVRWKRRQSFAYKGEFAYELTEVRSGYTEAEALSPSTATEYEVELEWVGQVRAASRIAADPGYATHLAASMAAKVQDLLDMCQEARRQRRVAAAVEEGRHAAPSRPTPPPQAWLQGALPVKVPTTVAAGGAASLPSRAASTLSITVATQDAAAGAAASEAPLSEAPPTLSIAPLEEDPPEDGADTTADDQSHASRTTAGQPAAAAPT